MKYEEICQGPQAQELPTAAAAPFLPDLLDAAATRCSLKDFEQCFQAEGLEHRPACEHIPSCGASMTIKRADGCWWASAEFDESSRIRVITLGAVQDIDDPARDSKETFDSLVQLARGHLGAPCAVGGDALNDSAFVTWICDDVTIEVKRTPGPFVFMMVTPAATLSNGSLDKGFVMAMAPGRPA